VQWGVGEVKLFFTSRGLAVETGEPFRIAGTDFAVNFAGLDVVTNVVNDDLAYETKALGEIGGARAGTSVRALQLWVFTHRGLTRDASALIWV
jgi:hypothetical protein